MNIQRSCKRYYMGKKEDSHYVYILECKDGTFYTGYTNNLKRRIDMHQRGKGAKYTRGRTPVKIIHQEQFSSKGEALQREYYIKKLTREQKEQYITNNQGKGVRKFVEAKEFYK